MIALSKHERQASAHMVLSYIIRLIVCGGIIYYSLIIPEINTLAVVLPLFFPKVILIRKAFLGFDNK